MAQAQFNISPDEAYHYYSRTAKLLIIEGTKVLKAVFENTVGPQPLDVFLQNNKSEIDNKLKGFQGKTVFPKGKPVDLDTFDISILSTLILTTCQLSPNDQKLVKKLRDHRNNTVHTTIARITASDFEKIWKDIKDILCDLSLICSQGFKIAVQKDIQLLLDSPLDRESEQRYLVLLLEIWTRDSNIREEIQTKNAEDQKIIKKEFEAVQHKLAKLESLKAHVDDLKKAVENLADNLTLKKIDDNHSILLIAQKIERSMSTFSNDKTHSDPGNGGTNEEPLKESYARSQNKIPEACSWTCPSGTQSFEETYESIVSSIGRNLETLDLDKQELRVKEQKIENYLDNMPPELKTGYFDVMILYDDLDRDEANTFRDYLMSLEMKNGRSVKAVLHDDAELVSLPGSQLQHLEEAYKRCTFTFMFLTKNFCENWWCKFSSDQCLSESISKKKWTVVPVYTSPNSKDNLEVPMSLNALKGVNYYGKKEIYEDKLVRLIGDRLNEREEYEKKLQDKRYAYALKLEEEARMKLMPDTERHKQQRSHNTEHMSSQCGDGDGDELNKETENSDFKKENFSEIGQESREVTRKKNEQRYGYSVPNEEKIIDERKHKKNSGKDPSARQQATEAKKKAVPE